MTERSVDTVRVAATLVGAVGQAVLPTVLSSRFGADDTPPDVLQPAPYTFAIWAPIFAGSLAEAVVQAQPGLHRDPLLRAVGGPLALATLGTAAWAPLVATRRYWAAQAALGTTAVFAEHARVRLAGAEAKTGLSPGRRAVVAAPVSMLAGWGAAATAVNLGAMLVGEGPVPEGRPATAVGVGLTLAVGGTAALRARRTASAAPITTGIYAGTVLWALGGIIVGQRRRSPPVAAAAAVAAAVVIAALRR